MHPPEPAVQAPADPALLQPGTRLPGERFWWVGVDGTMLVRSRICTPTLVPLASGRVCDAARIGVIERCGGCHATLGLIPAGLIELLARRLTAELARQKLDDIARQRQLDDAQLNLIRSRYDSRLALLPPTLEPFFAAGGPK